MHTATSATLLVVHLTGITQVVLGLLFWSGRAYTLLPLHMLIGMVFVTGLWVLAGLAARAGLRIRWVLLAVAWGIVVPAFGVIHPRLLPGPGHWIVRVIHLLIGVAAMIIAARLASYIRGRREPARLATENARSAA